MEFDTQPEKGSVSPRFYVRAIEDVPESRKAGRPIFKDVEYVDVIIPGDKLTMPSFKVTDEHRKRWPQHYKAFKEGQTDPVVGTPLKEWPALTTSQVEELKAIRIYTVEALADLSDQGLQNVGLGARSLQAKAKAFLEQAKGSANVQRYAEENEKLKVEMSRQAELIKELAAEVKALRDNKPKRGPKKKFVEEAIANVAA